MNHPISDIRIRTAVPEDAEALLAIYAPYVTDTAITFEYDVPSVEEFRTRIQTTLKQYPYLVAEWKGEILGYAYLSPFHPRRAYQWAAETSIYIRQDCHGMGTGRKLYQALERMGKGQNIVSFHACIGYCDREDEHLTKDSVRFHEHMGYRLWGKAHQRGYKFGRWYDVVWMEKFLTDPPDTPKVFIPFPALPTE